MSSRVLGSRASRCPSSRSALRVGVQDEPAAPCADQGQLAENAGAHLHRRVLHSVRKLLEQGLQVPQLLDLDQLRGHRAPQPVAFLLVRGPGRQQSAHDVRGKPHAVTGARVGKGLGNPSDSARRSGSVGPFTGRPEAQLLRRFVQLLRAGLGKLLQFRRAEPLPEMPTGSVVAGRHMVVVHARSVRAEDPVTLLRHTCVE